MSDRSEVYRHQSASEAVDPESSMGNELAFITVPKPVVLDVGCACGDFGAMLKRERNAELYGLEYDAGSIEIALSTGAYTRIDQQNLDSLTQADYPEYRGKFDYIVCGDVLEHLRDPMHVLSILKTYLKTEGHIVASIPNVAHMSVKANLLDDTFEYMPVGLLDKTHVHLFSHKSISEDLASVGLRIFSCRFTLQEKEGMQPHQPYEKLPVSVLKLLFEDWHSYVCQYVMLIGEDAHPAQILAFLNELAIQIDETTAPESIRFYRENLLRTYLPSRGPDREEVFQVLADDRKERLDELCREGDRLRAEIAELRTERATESAAREKLIADCRKLEGEKSQERASRERAEASLVEVRAEGEKSRQAHEKLQEEYHRLDSALSVELCKREQLEAESAQLREETERLRAEIAELRTERATESAAREKLIADCRKLEGEKSQERASRERAETHLMALREETERLRAEVVELNKACDRWATDKVRVEKEKLDVERLLAELRASPSWRITAPLRLLKHKAQKIRNRLQEIKSRMCSKREKQRLCRSLKDCELIFDHNLGGGANSYRNRFIEERLEAGIPCILAHNNLWYGAQRDFSLKIRLPSWTSFNDMHFASWEECAQFLAEVRIRRIVYNNLVYNPAIREILRWITVQKSEVLVLMHDFFPICQFYNMVGSADGYCAMKEDCNRCIADHPDKRHLFDSPCSGDEWKSLWQPIFDKASEVRIFSPFASDLVVTAYPSAAGKIKCVPHSMEYFKQGPVELDPGEGPTLAVIGSIYNAAKGLRVVDDLAQAIAPRKLVVIGTYDGPAHDNIIATGMFDRDELPLLLKKYAINIVFFPSIWPETFSYIVSELIQMRIPLLSFDLGAQGEKVRQYDRGAVISEILSEVIIDKANCLYRKVYGK